MCLLNDQFQSRLCWLTTCVVFVPGTLFYLPPLPFFGLLGLFFFDTEKEGFLLDRSPYTRLPTCSQGACRQQCCCRLLGVVQLPSWPFVNILSPESAFYWRHLLSNVTDHRWQHKLDLATSSFDRWTCACVDLTMRKCHLSNVAVSFYSCVPWFLDWEWWRTPVIQRLWRSGLADGLRAGALPAGALCWSGVRAKLGIDMVVPSEDRVTRLSKEGRIGPGRWRSRQKSPCGAVVGSHLWIGSGW